MSGYINILNKLVCHTCLSYLVTSLSLQGKIDIIKHIKQEMLLVMVIILIGSIIHMKVIFSSIVENAF